MLVGQFLWNLLALTQVQSASTYFSHSLTAAPTRRSSPPAQSPSRALPAPSPHRLAATVSDKAEVSFPAPLTPVDRALRAGKFWSSAVPGESQGRVLPRVCARSPCVNGHAEEFKQSYIILTPSPSLQSSSTIIQPTQS